MNQALYTGLERCIADMKEAVQNGKMTMEAQVRAYDLLECLLDVPAGEEVAGGCDPSSGEGAPDVAEAAAFLSAYAGCSDKLSEAYDEAQLRAESEAQLAPLRKTLKEAEDRHGIMSELHECAKKTYDIWNHAGFFARQKALRILRQKAGFRLESKRIGNYVAKTFDLMNEAASAYARAQQALFAADRAYKIRPGIYGDIAAALKPKRS